MMGFINRLRGRLSSWVTVWPQREPHGDMVITADRKGMLLISMAALRASVFGKSLAKPFAYDGEGYNAHFIVTTYGQSPCKSDHGQHYTNPFEDAETACGSEIVYLLWKDQPHDQ